MADGIGARVLVADDEPEVRSLIQRALARKGIDCDLAEDGIAAEKKLAQHRYDVVLVDLRMPHKHGHRVIVDMLERKDRPTIIAITGLTEPKIIADLYERGVDDVLLKPLSMQLVASKVKALLDRDEPGGRHSGGESGASSNVSKRIEQTTSSLKAQLAEVQTTFQSTIQQLEKQRDELETGYLDSLRVLTGLIEQLGKFKGSHAVRVENLSGAIGRRLELDRKLLHSLKTAALLHDLGQFGMPDHIRSKAPWQLEGEDLAAYRSYPTISAALLSEIRGSEQVVEIIESHAENYDGSGFPHGKQGSAIPLGARILRIADGADTYAMNNPGEDAKSVMREHLVSRAGEYYDPELVKVAVQCLTGALRDIEVEATEIVPVKDLREGMVLADNVYDEFGRFLARKGAVVTRNMLRRLQQLVVAYNVSIFKESTQP